MFKEIGHFMRNGKEAARLQKEHPRAEFCDLMMSKADAQGYANVRRELVGDLNGRVLDLGCGTGSMFEYYGPGARVEAVEPEADFLTLAESKAASASGTIRVAAGNGMELAFADGSFDSVVLGLVLCSVPSVERVLAEAFRVLRPGGQLRALEHVRSEEAVAGFLMDIVNPLWLCINKQGCRLNRNPVGKIEAAGFQIDDVMAFKRFDTVMPAFPMRRIQAHKPVA
ncbi:MAG TPA: class I SAM-dependent methyltransferase [Polyangiaceae bacterium]|nr:class I SAM-dependent methyltransferase [Polyangiaceae bacterium]